MTDVRQICEVLDGKVRGNPVAISLFPESIPSAYQARKVDPCAILRHAMDDGETVYFDRENQDCLHGAFITGVHEGNEQIRSGRILTDYIPAYKLDAAHAVNSGKFILPQGTVKAIGAAPLDQVPEGVDIDWMAVVCTPFWASSIAAARSVEDGTPPSGAAGSSFCSELFVSPWYTDNVVMTPGDVGGRMNNRLKPEEMFVIIPMRWAGNLVSILGDTPDVKGIYEATRPQDSDYWEKQAAREARAESRRDKSADYAHDKGLEISMEWDLDAVDQVASAPKFVRRFAVGNVEDYALEKGRERITIELIREQMENAGVAKFMKFLKR